MLTGERLLHATLKVASADAALSDLSVQHGELRLCLGERYRDPAFLARAQLLAFDHDERAIELAYSRAQTRGANAFQFPRQLLHRAASGSMAERDLGCRVAQ